MSLINDALKRARQAHKKQPTPAASDAPLQPVEAVPSNRRPSLVVVTGAVLILGLGCWFLWQSWNTTQPAPVAVSKPSTNKAPAAVKSSVASNLTRPFQAVAKLDAALKEFRNTNASSPTNPPQTASTSAPARPVEQITGAASTPSVSADPAAEKTTNAVSALPQAATNEPPARPISRNVTFPPLKLQGIYLRLSRPSVLINNRTLFLGDEVEGVRIAEIERYSVKVVLKGATNELFLK